MKTTLPAINRVYFRMECGKPLAVFPDIYESSGFPARRRCYTHAEQHSSCSLEYCFSLPEARPDEYAELKTELENVVGYNLEIV